MKIIAEADTDQRTGLLSRMRMEGHPPTIQCSAKGKKSKVHHKATPYSCRTRRGSNSVVESADWMLVGERRVVGEPDLRDGPTSVISVSRGSHTMRVMLSSSRVNRDGCMLLADPD